MKYLIPNSKIEKLEKIIKKYQKKGADIIFEVGNEVIEQGTLYIEDSFSHTQSKKVIDVKCTEVFVEGHYIINGWQFVGTIEFTTLGNIIRLADSSFEGKVPLKYLHTESICEHCGKIRNRKDTYLIYNAETGEFKQVGSSCLLDFTCGLDANTCADIMSALDQVIELNNKEFNEDYFISYNDCSMDRDAVLKVAYAYVKQYGYQKMNNGKGTASDILKLLNNPKGDEEMFKRYKSLVMPSSEELAAIDEIARFNVEHMNILNNDYIRNASLTWLKSSLEFRDFSLVASFINSHFKELARKEELENSVANVFVGNIGDKIIIKVASVRVLYTKDNSRYSYYAEPSFVLEIIDTEGHTFKWTTNKNDVKVGDTIIATIKDHQTFNMVNQTVITRGIIQK